MGIYVASVVVVNMQIRDIYHPHQLIFDRRRVARVPAQLLAILRKDAWDRDARHVTDSMHLQQPLSGRQSPTVNCSSAAAYKFPFISSVFPPRLTNLPKLTSESFYSCTPLHTFITTFPLLTNFLVGCAFSIFFFIKSQVLLPSPRQLNSLNVLVVRV